MEIPEKLLKFKFQILSVFAFSLLIFFLCYLAPSFLDVLKYFWPLLVSTALFLVAIVVFGQISPPAAEAPGEKAAEGLLDYVASEPEQIQPLLEEVGREKAEREEEREKEEEKESVKAH